jgi:hypothetical protein
LDRRRRDNRAIVKRHGNGPDTKPYFDELLTTAGTSNHSKKAKGRINDELLRVCDNQADSAHAAAFYRGSHDSAKRLGALRTGRYAA